MNSVTSMNCPVCSVALVMSDRQGIEIDYCPQCRGVWLDRGELDKIIERSTPSARAALPVTDNDHRSNRGFEGNHDRNHKKKRRKSFLEDLFD